MTRKEQPEKPNRAVAEYDETLENPHYDETPESHEALEACRARNDRMFEEFVQRRETLVRETVDNFCHRHEYHNVRVASQDSEKVVLEAPAATVDKFRGAQPVLEALLWDKELPYDVRIETARTGLRRRVQRFWRQAKQYWLMWHG